MKKITTLLSALLLTTSLLAQAPSKAVGGEYIPREQGPCLTQDDYTKIFKDINRSRKALVNTNKLPQSPNFRLNNPSFIWPVQKAQHVTINNVWAVSNYVDHNVNAGALQDYNCGTRTYDLSNYNHQGVDIFTWPFGWKMMEDNDAEIIAAASGTILNKFDGNNDRSCNPNVAADWNAVYIEHSDGSVALYGHMKNGSLTTKNIGDPVAEGEYLGIIGSSGRSSGPHLHFEVFDYLGVDGEGDPIYELKDPYYLDNGCNTMNNSSWWQDQKPYYNKGINAVLVTEPDPIFPSCPNTETTNIVDEVALDQHIFLPVFFRAVEQGEVVTLSITGPEFSVPITTWQFTIPGNYNFAWWRWEYYPDIAGQWEFKATYAGETSTFDFTVGNLSLDDYTLNNLSVYPNPTNSSLHINSKETIIAATIVDVRGRIISNIKDSNITTIDLSNLPNSMYFVTLQGKSGHDKTLKILKE